MDELIERTRLAAKILRDIGGQSAMAATVEEAAAALEAAREDAERYRWLRMMAREQLLNPKAAGAEYCPDMRTYWRLPTLICSGPVGGFMSFDAAIDQARGKGVKDEA